MDAHRNEVKQGLKRAKFEYVFMKRGEAAIGPSLHIEALPLGRKRVDCVSPNQQPRIEVRVSESFDCFFLLGRAAAWKATIPGMGPVGKETFCPKIPMGLR